MSCPESIEMYINILLILFIHFILQRRSKVFSLNVPVHLNLNFKQSGIHIRKMF